MSRSPERAVLFVVLLCLDVGILGWAPPVCARSATRCRLLSLTSLLNLAVQLSVRLHDLSSDLHAELVQNLSPSRHHLIRGSPRCHTSRIQTPNGKDNAQQLTREELVEVVLKLLSAWRDPLRQLHQGGVSWWGSKVLEMSDMVHKLREGVERVTEKMLLLGMINNRTNAPPPPKASQPTAVSQEALSDYELLYCFRRDSDKVRNYLKILQCVSAPERGC